MNSFILLAGGSLITPDPGLYIWSTIIFLLLLFLLSKFAFKPIFNGIRSRNEAIDNALKSAERARAEVAELKNENIELLNQAKEERSKILKEANELKAKIIEDAKDVAKVEATKLVTEARQDIATQKAVAFAEVKEEVGKIAVEIAEKVMRQKLDTTESQQQLIANLLDDANFNQN